MTRAVFMLILGLFLPSCIDRPSGLSDTIPTDVQPSWEGIDLAKMPVKPGQVFAINGDSIDLTALVVDFDFDEGGVWIGLCFMNEAGLFGLQIPSGMITTTCLDLLDLAYIHIDGLHDFQVLDALDLDNSKIGIGGISPAMELTELERIYVYGVELRRKKQTPCSEVFAGLNPVRECYFEIERIKP